MPALQGNQMPRVQPIFWMHEGNRAVRSGPWKAVKKFREPWELYNIELDRTEQNNLAQKEPVLLQHLARQWDQWALASYVDEWEGNFRTNWGRRSSRSDQRALELARILEQHETL